MDLTKYKDLSVEEIEKHVNDYFAITEQRNIKLYTGPGGADLFDETVENGCGMYRVYIGLKVPRFLRLIKNIIIKKSRVNGFYRLKMQAYGSSNV